MTIEVFRYWVSLVVEGMYVHVDMSYIYRCIMSAHYLVTDDVHTQCLRDGVNRQLNSTSKCYVACNPQRLADLRLIHT